MKPLIISLLLIATITSAQSKRIFTGTITDNMCPAGDHSRMRMGSNDAECTLACNSAHGATYVLYDGKNTYELSDQQSPEKFAGKKVTITGMLDAKTGTIHVDSIAALKNSEPGKPLVYNATHVSCANSRIRTDAVRRPACPRGE